MPRHIKILLPCIFLLWAMCTGVRAETLRLPITLDYAFLQAALKHQAFKAPGGKAVVLNHLCNSITLWNPRLSRAGSLLRMRCSLKVEAGMEIMEHCIAPTAWQGQVETFHRVWVDPKTLRLKVRTVKSRLLDNQLRPAAVQNMVYELVQDYVHDYLDGFRVNLAGPVKNLKSQIPFFFSAEMHNQAVQWLNTLRSDATQVQDGAVRINLLLNVKLPKAKPKSGAKPIRLSPAQRKALMHHWETWDAFLVREIMTLARRPLIQSEKDLVLEVLLDTRHGIHQALQDPDPNRDLVRRQFIETWRRLSPLLRKHLWAASRPETHLPLLAFMTAADVLKALDRLGPAMGLEISEEGLKRLARLLGPGRGGLSYTHGENPALRSLLGMGPALKLRPPPKLEDLPEPETAPDPDSWLRWLPFRATPAWAKKLTVPMRLPTPKEISHWLPPEKNTRSYLYRVQGLVRYAQRRVLDESGLSRSHKRLLGKLIPATIWQESCWRHFTVRKNKITYLLSSNKSSVGLTQVNQRIWRGLYSLQHLRWDIVYNAWAGCEIMELYLRRFVLGRLKPGRHISGEFLVRAVYAMYNGGPGQWGPFLRRYKKKRYWLSDKLFWQKYKWVTEGDYTHISRCLPGLPPPNG